MELCIHLHSSPARIGVSVKTILVLASGGVFSEGPWKSWDYVEPYLRQILGFIGIEDVQTVRAEGMNIPPLAIHAVPNGEKAVEALVI
jgi:FMN-dependent NADH-azoreductase